MNTITVRQAGQVLGVIFGAAGLVLLVAGSFVAVGGPPDIWVTVACFGPGGILLYLGAKMRHR